MRKINPQYRPGIRDDVSELQEELQKLNPCFRSGEAARDAQWRFESELRAAMQKAEEPCIKADINSTDPIERLAAKFSDAAQKEGLRMAWDGLFDFQQGQARQLVREEMCDFGVVWPEKGNPFE